MIFALLGTALLTGLLTIVATWPLLGAWAFAAGPVVASLATLVVAMLFGLGSEEEVDLHTMSDRLVAELRAASPREQSALLAARRAGRRG